MNINSFTNYSWGVIPWDDDDGYDHAFSTDSQLYVTEEESSDLSNTSCSEAES